MPRSNTVPAYRKHAASGQAVVTIRLPCGKRRDIYLGKHNSSESLREYGRIVAELATSFSTSVPFHPAEKPADITIAEIMAAYMRFAQLHYFTTDEPMARRHQRSKNCHCLSGQSADCTQRLELATLVHSHSNPFAEKCSPPTFADRSSTSGLIVSGECFAGPPASNSFPSPSI